MIKEYTTLLPLAGKHRWAYILGGVSLVIASGSQLIIPQFIRQAIDIISYGDFSLASLARPLVLMLATALAVAVGRLGWRFWIHGASRRIEGELREHLFSHLLRLSPAYYSRTSVGDLMARATNDLNAVRMAAGMALVAAVDGLFMTTAILIILFTQTPELAMYTVIPLPLITLFILMLGRAVGKLFRGVQDSFSVVSTQAQEVFTGIAVVQAYAKEDHFIHRYMAANKDYQQRNMQLVRIWGLFMPVITFLSGITTLLLLRFGGEQVILAQISPGTFVATLSYLQLLIWPMIGAGMTVNLLQRGAASLQRINEVLAEEPDILETAAPVPVQDISSIEVRNLDFGYADEQILHGISLTIPSGHSIGILGRTGSGKSTLVQLLCRLYNPPAGSIYVNGSDILDLNLHDLRRSIGVVTQDSFLFSTTVRTNIGFGLEQAEQDQLERAAVTASIDKEIRELPGQWDTMIGERGITLSGGQKQRTTIARALAVHPSLLIFDDALSAVDTHTEEKILTELFRERSDQTNIIISHRISTLSHADYIYVLDQGRVAQQGTHQELTQQPGLYLDTVRLQQLDEQHEEHQ